MYRRLSIALLLTCAVTGAAAQARYTITPANSASSGGRGQLHSSPRTSDHDDPPPIATGAKGGVGDRYDIHFPKPESERIYRGNSCYRGRCGYRGSYYPYIPYAPDVYLETSIGPDFNAQPSAYTAYGPSTSENATSAAALDLAYRQGAMEQRMVSLADEVARLRAEKEARLQKGTAAETRPDQSTAAPGSFISATLVFRDGQRLQIGNYAVVGNSLWVFDENRSRKFSLDSLDLPATKKVNADLGVDFRIPIQKTQK